MYRPLREKEIQWVAIILQVSPMQHHSLKLFAQCGDECGDECGERMWCRADRRSVPGTECVHVRVLIRR